VPLLSLRRQRRHPPTWLSSHKLGRAFALAAYGRSTSASLPAAQAKQLDANGSYDPPAKLISR